MIRTPDWVVLVPLLNALLLGTACIPGQGRGDREQDCTDALDNDGDGDVDCADSDCTLYCNETFQLRLLPDTTGNRAVDVLFVLDNSPDSDLSEQRHFLPLLLNELRRRAAGPPDIHVGVTTSDLGGGGLADDQCDDVGDAARLLKQSCIEPTGVSWIVDSAPRDCLVERDNAGLCIGHDCTPDSCTHESTAVLTEDFYGCPRCRNFTQQSAGNVLSCMADVGYWGCPFEQQLEVMRRALDDHPDNIGFLRDDAHLAVVLVNTEDDCSVADPSFWDDSDTSLESPLGPASNYRCFEFGVTCDVNDRTTEGVRTGCGPRNDPGALLHPIERYTDFLLGRKDPSRLTVVTLAGPVEADSVTVRMGENGFPEVGYECLLRIPGIRLTAFARTIRAAHALSASVQTKCEGYLSDSNALQAAGRAVLRGLGEGCAPKPPLGCTDIAVALGQPGDGRACNDSCLPSCEVTDVQHAGTAQEIVTVVASCVQVCHDGPCPQNQDPALAWYGAHPPALDPELPVSACWHFTYLDSCEEGNGARFVVSRREPLSGWSQSDATCEAVLSEEGRCTDGLDNDGDCLTDLEDPDCGLATP